MNNLTTNNNNKNITTTINKLNNCNSNIPLRTQLSRTNSNSSASKIPINNNPEIIKWKQKYEDADTKRKSILIEKEKVLRKYQELERKYVDLQIKHESLETELFEKNEEFTKLSTASKNLYKEYEMLKNQYETESCAMTSALKDASQWYKENKLLRRKTLMLLDGNKDTVDEGVDAGESTNSDAGESTNSDADIENLNKTIKQLSLEIAELQTEVDSLKQIEFQTNEQNCKLIEELDNEKEKTKKLSTELTKLNQDHEQVLRVSEMLKKELTELKELEENQRNNAVILRKQADDYKKERNVLAHQSTLLLQGLNDADSINLLQNIEELKRTIEDERNKHDEEIALLQEKLEAAEANSQIELLEERLKLAESELQVAMYRAEKAEKDLEVLKQSPPPPPPPPPPPAPLAPPCSLPDQPPEVPLRLKRRSRSNVMSDLAEAIGVDESSSTAAGTTTPVSDKKKTGVNDDIINAIKEGKFTLRKAKNVKKERETTKAVSEMLNILGNLRRAPQK